jgi:SAM-dependent methyltransferase
MTDPGTQHYSYRVYADPETARSFDDDRFGGPIGQLIKFMQERVVFSTLGDVQGWKIADIGAGTGRFTVPFLNSGACVTACDASAQMLEVLREKTGPAEKRLSIQVADAHDLYQLAADSFDCAVSFRMLMHVINWKQALSELCRISRDWVVFDFPPRHGFQILAPMFHRLRRLFSSNVQPYATFAVTDVLTELGRCGFRAVRIDPGFFLPLVIHRLLHAPTFTRHVEGLFRKVGLTRLGGSPFTVFARREE